MNTVIILFGVILIHVFPFGLIFWIAWKKDRATLRLMAILIALTQISFGFFVWLAIRESWVIFIAVVFAALTGLNILALPLTAPKLFKNLKIKW